MDGLLSFVWVHVGHCVICKGQVAGKWTFLVNVFPRLSPNKISTVIGWLLVTCPWPMYPDWDMALSCSVVLVVQDRTDYVWLIVQVAISSAYAHFSMIDEADQTKLPDFSLKQQEHKCLTVIIEGKFYIYICMHNTLCLVPQKPVSLVVLQALIFPSKISAVSTVKKTSCM